MCGVMVHASGCMFGRYVCHQLTCAWWIKGGVALVVAYSDGTLITFDTKTVKMRKDLLNITSESL